MIAGSEMFDFEAAHQENQKKSTVKAVITRQAEGTGILAELAVQNVMRERELQEIGGSRSSDYLMDKTNLWYQLPSNRYRVVSRRSKIDAGD